MSVSPEPSPRGSCNSCRVVSCRLVSSRDVSSRQSRLISFHLVSLHLILRCIVVAGAGAPARASPPSCSLSSASSSSPLAQSTSTASISRSSGCPSCARQLQCSRRTRALKPTKPPQPLPALCQCRIRAHGLLCPALASFTSVDSSGAPQQRLLPPCPALPCRAGLTTNLRYVCDAPAARSSPARSARTSTPSRSTATRSSGKNKQKKTYLFPLFTSKTIIVSRQDKHRERKLEYKRTPFYAGMLWRRRSSRKLFKTCLIRSALRLVMVVRAPAPRTRSQATARRRLLRLLLRSSFPFFVQRKCTSAAFTQTGSDPLQ